ncbi:uncharacterized protein LOC100573235 [Acyrthosiphon pisum]|uniref:Uncharacterized protein n=1 Tax=Acyrthosiphon pisum TaxID=7029 RepID=A0A8R2AFV2_ACYPI|nr:uncharacterized protein LOC100573235 [Acyrthosiphon pisum]|eukprot:XP_003242574.1 PREDICTED: uncharacterized protein LOC100573235 [Acyrthosiphon pisum]
MGSFCSKTSSQITRAIEKTSSTPQIRQPQVKSKLDPNSTLPAPTNKQPSSLSNQPKKKGVVGKIAKQATAVAIGTAVGNKLSNMFDDKKDVETTVESPTETDNSKYNIDNQMKNEELTEDDSGEQGDQGDQGDEEDEENDDDSN